QKLSGVLRGRGSGLRCGYVARGCSCRQGRTKSRRRLCWRRNRRWNGRDGKRSNGVLNRRNRTRTVGDCASAVGVALQALQVGANVGGALLAQVAIFFERLVDDVLELFREVGVQADRRNRGAVENRLKNQRGSLSAKRQVSGGHFVEHDAERKQIGARIEFFSLGLLR